MRSRKLVYGEWYGGFWDDDEVEDEEGRKELTP